MTMGADFDWQHPVYEPIFAERAARIQRIRSHPDLLPGLRNYYSEPNHCADFLNDFGVVFEPRNAERGLPTSVPFLLFDKQREWIAWVLDLWQRGLPGLTEKSRDCGASTMLMGVSCWMCLFYPGMAIGVGSAKESKIDNGFDPDTLFFKARYLLQNLPPELRGGFDPQRHSAHMRLLIPETGSSITGESGDNIGRGGRKAIYWVDESAHLERPQAIEASLASNTNCRQDISSVAGLANPFAQKRHSGKIATFSFHWRSDPRKGSAWYERQKQTLDPVSLAQEVDMDYRASVEGALLPGAWIQSAIGALEKLGIAASGVPVAALDCADEGRDKNAFAGRHGPLLEYLATWSGEGSDIFSTTLKAFSICDDRGYNGFRFDSDGLGAGVRGDARVINDQRGPGRRLNVVPYRGSAQVADPDGALIQGRRNSDFFSNLKAQSWWALRLRFQNVHRAVSGDGPCDSDSLIGIPPDLPGLQQLIQELSQPTFSLNLAGKIVIDKAPAGFKSPNLADAVAIAFSPFQSDEFFPESMLVPGGGTRPLPSKLRTLYAVVAASSDAVAVVYFGVGIEAVGSAQLIIVDWDFREIDPGLFATWVPALKAHFTSLFEETHAMDPRAACIFCDTSDGIGGIIAAHAEHFEFSMTPIPDDFPHLPDRPRLARTFIRVGVEYGPQAMERTVTYRGQTRNFLRDQMGGLTVTADDALALAFATGVLLKFWDAG
jgi:phage terminase large subunit